MAQDAVESAAADVVGHIQAQGHHLRLDYAGVSTAYHSDEGTSAAWIEQFLKGYFRTSDTGEADAAVYSTADAALFASLQSLASQQPTLGKNDYVEIPLTDAVALIHTKATKVTPEEDVYRLLFTRQRRIVLVTSGNPEVRREEGMQTLRALGKWLLLEKGWIPMHSACVAKGGRAICVAGEKASGKTSTLLNLLARGGCDLLAIDKFLIRESGSHLEVCGLPGKSGIRVGSAVVHPQVLDWLARARSPFFPHISAEEVQHIAATNTPEGLRNRSEKIHLLPAELAEMFGTQITPTAPLGLLLVPVFDLGVEEPRLVSVDPEPAIMMLAECYAGLLSKGEGFLLHFFDLSDDVLKERLAMLLSRHLPQVGTYELHQNHTTNEQAAALVGNLLSSRS
jgi:hypothetical protein